MRNIIIFILCVLFLISCSFQKTYEVFKNNNDANIGTSHLTRSYAANPVRSSKCWSKQNYDNDSYIYIDLCLEGDGIDSRCNYGFITSKDDPKQVITGWKIISGKEFCKERQKYSCCI